MGRKATGPDGIAGLPRIDEPDHRGFLKQVIRFLIYTARVWMERRPHQTIRIGAFNVSVKSYGGLAGSEY